MQKVKKTKGKFNILSDYKNDPFAYNQIKIAQKTLKMVDCYSFIMGGPSKEESREILKKFNIKIVED